MFSNTKTCLLTALALFTVGYCCAFLSPQWGAILMFGPLAGIGVGALLTFGSGCVVGLWLGVTGFYLSFFCLWPGGTAFGSALSMAIGLGAGYALQAWASTRLICHFVTSSDLDNPRDIALFQAIGCLVGCTISSGIGIACVWAGGLVAADLFLRTWLLWLLWDMIGVLLFANIIFCFWGKPEKLWTLRRWSIVPLLITIMGGMIGMMYLLPLGTSYTPSWQLCALSVGSFVLLAKTTGILLYITGRNLYIESLMKEREHALANSDSALILASDEINDLDQELADSMRAAQRTNQLLREREMRLKALVNTATDAILTFDRWGFIESTNPATIRMFGFSNESLLGSSLEDLLPKLFLVDRPKTGEFVLTELKRSRWHELLGGSLETDGLREDGGWVPVELVVSLMDHENEDKFTAILRDVTERKRIEKIKSEFVSVVSHELRTPLTSLSGSLRLIENGFGGVIEPKAHNLIAIAMRNSERLIRLVNNILDLDKMQLGQLNLELSEFDSGSVLYQTLSQLRALADEAQVKLRPKVEGELLLHSDRDRFAQVVVNLVSNAIKFSPPDSEVEIVLEPLKDQESLRVSVIDHGPGIALEQMPLLFQKFSQLDASSTRAKGGTGLGLAISKELIGQLGGQIGVESKLGSGSTFWFSLPCSRQRLSA